MRYPDVGPPNGAYNRLISRLLIKSTNNFNQCEIQEVYVHMMWRLRSIMTLSGPIFGCSNYIYSEVRPVRHGRQLAVTTHSFRQDSSRRKEETLFILRKLTNNFSLWSTWIIRRYRTAYYLTWQWSTHPISSCEYQQHQESVLASFRINMHTFVIWADPHPEIVFGSPPHRCRQKFRPSDYLWTVVTCTSYNLLSYRRLNRYLLSNYGRASVRYCCMLGLIK